jgi:NADH-quinone oxidoreductase subunit G
MAAIIDPRPVQLPFAAVHLTLAPERLGAALEALPAGDFAAFSRQEATLLEGLAARLRQAKNPVLAGGVDLLGPAGVQALLAAARAFDSAERPCGATVLLGGPNSYGGALLAGGGPDADELLAAIEAGKVKALVCLESDPLGDHPDPPRMRLALAKLDLLIVLDCLGTITAAQAHLLLPTRVPAESAGTFVNQEGRMLPLSAVYEPGVPIQITGDGDHPPRIFEAITPGSEPRPGWEIIGALLGQNLSLQTVRQQLESADPRFAGLSTLDPEGTGRRVTGSPPLEKGTQTAGLKDSGGFASTSTDEIPPAPLYKGGKSEPERDGLRLLAIASLYGSEAIAAFSPVLDDVRPQPHALLHVDDAARLGLAAGETVRLHTDIGEATAVLELSTIIPPGLVLVPRLRGTQLAIFVPGGPLLPCRLSREEAP